MALPDYNPDTILIEAAKLAPDKAIEYFRSLGFKITWDWRETLLKANKNAFTVAKSMNMDVLQDVRKMVDKALTDGITFKTFKKELEPMLVSKGWWGEKVVAGKRVRLGSVHRLKTIYETNTQTAYNVGRWDVQVRDKKRRPFLRLNEVLDSSTRKTHEEVSGTIAPIGARFWDRWYPPNGFNCRGRVQSLKQSQVDSLGGISKVPRGVKPDKGFDRNSGKTAFKPKSDRNDSDLRTESKKMKPIL